MKLKIPKFLIKATGDIKVSPYPLWVQYKPQMHMVKGLQVRQIINIVKPGDILLRRFDGYLNTIFTPGLYGHAAVYTGNNQIIHAVGKGVISEDILKFCRCDAIAVLEIINAPPDLIDYAVGKAISAADENVQYDFAFETDNKKWYCTEMCDIIYKGIFYEEYIWKFGKNLLTPDGIRYSPKARLKLEIKP